jgi:hypothetical protein
MPTSQWHKFYSSNVAAPPGVLFELLADMPRYDRWLPGSEQFRRTYSFEPEDSGTRMSRWLVLDIAMPGIFRPLRSLILSSFDKETYGPWTRSRNTPRPTPALAPSAPA